MRNLSAVFAVALMLSCGLALAEASHELSPVPEALQAAAKEASGWKALLKDDLSNTYKKKNSWAYKEGVLEPVGKSDIWTKEKYGDFILDLEFKMEKDTNSGVFIRCSSIVDWLNTAIEVQVLQPNADYKNPKWHCGSIFDCLAPVKQMVKEAGEWNHYTIIAKDNMIWVELNGEQVLSMDLNLWTEAHKNPDGTDNKFKYAYKDLERKGVIGFQYHGHPVWFRNLKIKPLD